MENVTLTDINIPFGRLVVIALKWIAACAIVGSVAAIPVIVLWILLVVALLS